jgi:hypothetical protein
MKRRSASARAAAGAADRAATDSGPVGCRAHRFGNPLPDRSRISDYEFIKSLRISVLASVERVSMRALVPLRRCFEVLETEGVKPADTRCLAAQRNETLDV